jgi:hypothetical protein
MIKSDDGVTLIELPLTLGVVGAVLLPVWVDVGAIAALAANYRIAVEKVEREPGRLSRPESPLIVAGTGEQPTS